MMEIKLLVALCALLLINLGSADHDATHAPVSNAANSDGGKGVSEAPAPESVPSSGQEPVIPTTAAATHLPDTDSSSRVTSNVTTTEGTPELNNRNDTNNETSSEVAGSKKNLTDQATTQPPNPPSESNSTTSHIPLATTINPAHTDHTAPVDSTLTTAQATNTSDHAKSAAPTQKLETNPSPTTIIIIIKETSPTSKDSSSEKPPTSETSTVHAPQPDEHPGTTAASHQINTSPTLRSLSTQTRADVPSKLNVEGNTTMVHDSHTLDPLLAGLVSAFIITAVIITVLLFLKLRRRDNRPEFRRLQDLPMDDMMEDTPLSMYSY